MGLPFKHTELEFLIRPLAGEIAPGVQMPRLPRVPHSVSIALIKAAMARRVAG